MREDVGAKTLKYLYDLGDGWKHTIKIERLIDPAAGLLYPRLIEAKSHCPPEDVGGPWGYVEFLEAMTDPKHERHRELKEPPYLLTRGAHWSAPGPPMLTTATNDSIRVSHSAVRYKLING